jgi:hypothetical protein
MVIALVLFGLAALGGLLMARIRFGGAERPPLWIALVHGTGAAAGLIALIVALTVATLPSLARTALIVFIVAAAGGFYLFAHHLQKKPLPIPVVVIHGLVAVTGFVLLLVAAMHAE